MYFGTKSYLKSTRNHTTKHALYVSMIKNQGRLIKKLFLIKKISA
jgi:hypothetical protein